MRQKALSPEWQLPEFAYGSVWLVGAGDGHLRHFSPLAVHALGTADAVIHDLAVVPSELLDLRKGSPYREAGPPDWTIPRTIRPAQDGWRVVYLVEGTTMERAIECAARCAEQEIAFRVVPGAGEAVGREAPLGLLLVRKIGSARQRGSSLVARPGDPAERISAGRQANPAATRIFDVRPCRLARLDEGRRQQ
jgi:siroheme synthase